MNNGPDRLSFFRLRATVLSDMMFLGREKLNLPDGTDNLSLRRDAVGLVSLWRLCSGVDIREIKERRLLFPSAYLYLLIRHYDDMFDAPGSDLSRDGLKFDPENVLLLRKATEEICANTSSDKQSKEFLREMAAFRREQWRLKQGFADGEFGDVTRHKIDTVGLSADFLSSLGCLYFPTDGQTRVENAALFRGMILALQVRDDLKDWRIDTDNRTPNFFIAASRLDLEEHTRIAGYLSEGKHRVDGLRDIAPNTFDVCDRTFEEFLIQSPDKLLWLKNAIRGRYYFLRRIVA